MPRDLYAELHQRPARAELELTLARKEHAAADERAAWTLTLFAAVSRLCDAREPSDVFDAMGQIAGAVLGCRDLAVYIGDGSGVRLRREHARGELAALAPDARVGEGPIGEAVAKHRTIAGAVEGSPDPIVAVPLGATPGGIGAVVLYDVLAGRSELDADDLQLIEVVARHAGSVLAGRRAGGRRNGAG